MNEKPWLIWTPARALENDLTEHIQANQYLDQFLDGEIGYWDFLDGLSDCGVNVDDYTAGVLSVVESDPSILLLGD